MNELKNTEKLVDTFLKENATLLADLKSESSSLSDVCSDINASWSGSYIGYHGSYYYGDLTSPPPERRWSIEWGTINGVPAGWQSREGDEIKNEIEKRVGNGFKIEVYSDKGKSLFKSALKLKKDILIELSSFDFSENLKKEKSLFENIEKFNFTDIDQLRADYINSRIPKTKASRDTQALLEGTYIPSHVTTRCGVYSVEETIKFIDNFIDQVDTLIKQLYKKMDKKTSTHSDEMNIDVPLLRLRNTLTKFHNVACQLKVRHDSRNTLEINDEYDVQDLLHALLRIEFDDIRAEEWTPSYAGSSTRMDFLLKKEKMVVEVKRATQKLGAKQIGEQLILDIAHYKANSDCQKLVCFVYDPDSKIVNRQSLVNDLEKKHDGLDVELIIKP